MRISVFELDEVFYGIALADTREIFRAPSITALPGAPAVIEGIVNIRGRVIPVFNLRRRFGMADKRPHPSQHLILAQAGPRAVAMRVDRVLDMVDVDPADVTPPGELTPGESPFSGIAHLRDGLVLIHDLAAFLAEGEGQALDSALAARQ